MKKRKTRKKEKIKKRITRIRVIMLIFLLILAVVILFYLIPITANLCVHEVQSILICENREECARILIRETAAYGAESFLKQFISCDEEGCWINDFRISKECKENEFSLSIKTSRIVLAQIKKLSSYLYVE